MRHSLGLSFADQRPELALAIDAENAIVRAEAALALAQGSTDPNRRAQARYLARGALGRDAGNVAALTALAIASDRREQEAAALTAAGHLSRRNLITQLWLIETAVARNDVVDALRQYDIALRTMRSAPSILFPVLVEATSDPKLLPEITRTLSRQPPWGGLYLQQVAQSGSNLRGAASLFVLLKRREIATGDAADAALYARLIETQGYDDAWSVYAAGHPRAMRGGVRNPSFAQEPTTPAPFDWQVSDNEFVDARIEHLAGERGNLVYSTAAGEGGDAVRQMLVLPPGRYRLEAQSGAITASDGERPYLMVACRAPGAELARLSLQAERAGTVNFSVPAGCPAQMLTLMIPPASGLGTVEGKLQHARIISER